MTLNKGAVSAKSDLDIVFERASTKGATAKSRQLLLESLGISFHGNDATRAIAFRYDREFTGLSKDVFCSMLASACDLYASVSIGAPTSKKRIHLVVLMLVLEHDGNWRTCLTAPHDAHAFARNLMVARQIRGTDSMMGVFNEWLPGSKPLRYGGRPSALDIATRDRALISAMFGEAFWLFYGPENDTTCFDPEIILRERPPFMPGLLSRNTSLEQDLSLPPLS